MTKCPKVSHASLGAINRDAARALVRQKARATGLVVFCALMCVSTKALEGRHPSGKTANTSASIVQWRADCSGW